MSAVQSVKKPDFKLQTATKCSPSSHMESIFFDIHCSKLKPDPFGNLGEASDECVSHTMLFFSIGEAALDRFFSFVIEFPHTRCMPDIIGHIHVVRPYMLQYGFSVISALCAFRKVTAFFTYIRAAFKLFITFAVCC